MGVDYRSYRFGRDARLILCTEVFISGVVVVRLGSSKKD